MKNKLVIAIIFIIVGIVAYVLFDNDSNSGFDADRFIKENTYTLKKDTPQKRNNPEKEKISKHVQVSLVDIENFWAEKFPLTNIENSFLAQEQALSFIKMYEQQAEEGDPLASYLVNSVKLACEAVRNKPKNPIAKERNFKVNHDINSYCQSYLTAYQSNTEELYAEYKRARERVSFPKYGDKLIDAYDQIEIVNNKLVNEEAVESIVSDIGQERTELYSSLKLTNERLLNQKGELAYGYKLMSEQLARIDSSANLNAAWKSLSQLALSENQATKQEMAAWLVAVCSSGYSCGRERFLGNGLAAFNLNTDGYYDENWPPLEQTVKEYAGQDNYQQVLSRAMQISEYIADDEDEALICSVLSSLESGKVVC